MVGDFHVSIWTLDQLDQAWWIFSAKSSVLEAMFGILLVRLVKPGLQKEMNLLPRQIQAKKPGGNPLLQTKECLECSSNFTTVDGRNPATVDMIIKYPIIHRVFIHIRWCRISIISMDICGSFLGSRRKIMLPGMRIPESRNVLGTWWTPLRSALWWR